jgi:hypothetical protein
MPPVIDDEIDDPTVIISDEEAVEIPVICTVCGKEINTLAGEGVIYRRLNSTAPFGFGGVTTRAIIKSVDVRTDETTGRKLLPLSAKDPNTSDQFSGPYCTRCYPMQEFEPLKTGVK